MMIKIAPKNNYNQIQITEHIYKLSYNDLSRI